MKDSIKEHYHNPVPGVAYPDDYFMVPILGHWIGKETSHSEIPRLRWTRAIFKTDEPQRRRFNGEIVGKAGEIIYLTGKDLLLTSRN